MGRHSKEVAAVVELQTAVMVDGQPVTRLELRRPVFGDLEAMSESKSEIGQLLILVSKLADIRPAEARRRDHEDVVVPLTEAEAKEEAARCLLCAMCRSCSACRS